MTLDLHVRSRYEHGMVDARHNVWWRRTVAAAGLIVLCFWLVSTTHFHSAASPGSVRQECQLCVASNASHAFTPSSPVVTVALAILFLAIIAGDQVSLVHFRLPCSPRSPPLL